MAQPILFSKPRQKLRRRPGLRKQPQPDRVRLLQWRPKCARPHPVCRLHSACQHWQLPVYVLPAGRLRTDGRVYDHGPKHLLMSITKKKLS